MIVERMVFLQGWMYAYLEAFWQKEKLFWKIVDKWMLILQDSNRVNG